MFDLDDIGVPVYKSCRTNEYGVAAKAAPDRARTSYAQEAIPANTPLYAKVAMDGRRPTEWYFDRELTKLAIGPNPPDGN